MSKRNEEIGVLTPKTFRHDLSHSHTLTLDWFRLQPVCCVEMLDGDKFKVNLSSLIEAAPLATKVYGGAYLDFHAFFVPSRVVWSDWNNYRYGNGRTNDNTFVIPHAKLSQILTHFGSPTLKPENGSFVFSAADNDLTKRDMRRIFGGLGYPANGIRNLSGDNSVILGDNGYGDMLLSVMQARAYQRIWWDWYRDSVNIEESSKSSYLKTSGGNILATEFFQTFTPRYRCWRKDYITTLLPSPQMGNASSVNTSYSLGDVVSDTSLTKYTAFRLGNNGVDSSLTPYSQGLSDGTVSGTKSIVSSISVSAMRGAIAMQRFLEKLNVTGTRPIERMQSIFGSSPSPVRLDMSEFIGSHRQRVSISGLTNTGSNSTLSGNELVDNVFGIDDDFSNFGQQTGRCYSESQTPNFAYSATEDGYFIVIASLMPDFVNPTAVNRQFFRGLSTPDSSREDFYTHEFDGLTYQECLYNEISIPEYTHANQGLWGIDYDPYKVAGYQPKYEDYRYLQDRLSGDFNESDSSTALRNMVYVRNFQDGRDSGQLPTGIELTTSTQEDRADFDNHFQVTDSTKDHFILNLYFNIDAIRRVSKAELPTELSDLANSEQMNVANGGIRL